MTIGVGDWMIDTASGRTGTIRNIFLAGDGEEVEQAEADDPVAAVVLELDNGEGWLALPVTMNRIVPAETVLN